MVSGMGWGLRLVSSTCYVCAPRARDSRNIATRPRTSQDGSICLSDAGSVAQSSREANQSTISRARTGRSRREYTVCLLADISHENTPVLPGKGRRRFLIGLGWHDWRVAGGPPAKIQNLK